MENQANKVMQKKKIISFAKKEENNPSTGADSAPVNNNVQPSGPRPPMGPNGQPQQGGPRPPMGPNGQPQQGVARPPMGPNGQPQQGVARPPMGPNGQPQPGAARPPMGPNGQLQQGGPRPPMRPNGQPQQGGPRPPMGPNGQPQSGATRPPMGPNGQPQQGGPRPPMGPNGQPQSGATKPPMGPNGQPQEGGINNKPEEGKMGTEPSASGNTSATPNSTQEKPANAEENNANKGKPVKPENKKADSNKYDKPMLMGSIGKAGQYIGMCLIMFAFILMVPVVSQTGEEFLAENIIMAFVVAICMVFATIGYLTISVVLTAGAVVVFAAYKLYFKLVLQSNFYYVSYLWIIIPLIALLGVSLFISGYTNLQLENALLKKQVSQLVMVEPITGLYNLRSMYMDIQTQISYSERNNTQISLMIVKLRYPLEMRKVLKQKEYETVIKQLALLLADCVRLEDKVYSIGDDGSFGVILTCGTDGTKIVEKRIRSKLADPKWFSNVSTKHQVRAEVKIGYLQYDKNKYDRNANAFKENVEKQVERDV